MRSLCLVLALAIAGAAGPSRAAIYRWVDDSGHTRFSDRIEDVPPAWRKNVEQQIQDDAGAPSPPARPARAPAPAPHAPAAIPKAQAPAPPPAAEPASTRPLFPALVGAGVVGGVALLVLRRRRTPAPANRS